MADTQTAETPTGGLATDVAPSPPPVVDAPGADGTAIEHLDEARAELLEDSYVLRMTETEAEEHPGLTDDQHMIMNLGPQHPSTHGVLRVVLELEGETIRRSRPVIGYLHTGMEKTAESLTYLQGGTNVTRMDYASPIFNELAFCAAAEQLLG
ncbi:MAG: hypothetical protein KDB24_00285, partial [Microthrixaceae bacterium]|nr:hypothetical protein [Microthrixaceae bacterium]